MTYQEFKQKVDVLWEKFWTGGITNPLSVIEQITYLIFLKMLDMSKKIKRLVQLNLRINLTKQIFLISKSILLIKILPKLKGKTFVGVI